MRCCLLNECEICGARWAPAPIEREHAQLVMLLVENQHLVPPGCPECNEIQWRGRTKFYAEVQRQAGEGVLFIDGHRARMPKVRTPA